MKMKTTAGLLFADTTDDDLTPQPLVFTNIERNKAHALLRNGYGPALQTRIKDETLDKIGKLILDKSLPIERMWIMDEGPGDEYYRPVVVFVLTSNFPNGWTGEQLIDTVINLIDSTGDVGHLSITACIVNDADIETMIPNDLIPWHKANWTNPNWTSPLADLN